MTASCAGRKTPAQPDEKSLRFDVFKTNRFRNFIHSKFISLGDSLRRSAIMHFQFNPIVCTIVSVGPNSEDDGDL